MRVLVCGDRNWSDGFIIEQVLRGFGPGTVIIEGEARGADRLAGKIARRLGLEVVGFPAEWGKYGKKAGPLRNQQMLSEGLPDLVVAFHDNLEQSKGTGDMVRRAQRAEIPVYHVTHERRRSSS